MVKIIENSHQEEKSILVKLLFVLLLMGSGIIYTVIYLLLRNDQIFYKIVTAAFSILVFVITLIALVCLLGFWLISREKGDLEKLGRFVLERVRFLITPITLIGNLLGIEKERVQRAYTYFNNKVVWAGKYSLVPEEILLLLPHCLQNSRCNYKITRDVFNCKRCGKCTISEIIGLTERYPVKVSVVPGGTLARRAVEERKPRAVIAVACERDLSSGIQETKLFPVIGIINERPEGPCTNTRVDIKKIEDAIVFLTNGRC